MKFAPRNLALAAFAGILGGITSSIFLISLAWVSRKQVSEPGLLYFLPVAGLLIGGLYDRFGEHAGRGTNLVIEEIHRTKTRTPGRTTPLIFFTTLLSHLFGASVGREGTAVQMGASLADQLSRFAKISAKDRRILLQAGAAAGFAGALGAPIAGLIFGMEVLARKARFETQNVLECTIAAFLAVGVNRIFHVHHTVYGSLGEFPIFSVRFLVAAAGFGLLTGLIVRTFISLTELFGEVAKQFSKFLAVRAFCGGLMIIGLTAWFGNRASLGLGISSVQAAFNLAPDLSLPFEKLILTAVSIATGFRGGEFIPLIFMGATAASAIAASLGVSSAFGAACGITASFGSAARVPFALSIFAAEHFAPSFLTYALVANGAARLVVGAEATIFPSQSRA